MKKRPKLKGLRLSWPEVITVAAALDKAVKVCPRGQFVSEVLDRVRSKVCKRRDENGREIDRVEG